MELKELELVGMFIQQGRNIAQSTHDGINLGTDEEQERMPTSRYLLWKQDVGDFLYSAGFRDECEIFREADEIPILLGGEDLGYFNSPRMRQLRSNIRTEMPRKLAVLRTVRQKLESKGGPDYAGKEDMFLFYLSRSKGLYRVRNAVEEKYPVHTSHYRFKILNTLTEDFQRTEDLAHLIKTTSQKLRAQIRGMRIQIEKHFVGIHGDDFIDGEQRRGYRIGEKITLQKRE